MITFLRLHINHMNRINDVVMLYSCLPLSLISSDHTLPGKSL